MWVQSANPFHNTAISAAAALLPIALLFGLLVSRRAPGHVAALLTLGAALVCAAAAFGMPLRLALLAAFLGVLNGLFPIGWILFSALLLYNLSVRTGGFTALCRAIERITPDRRVQAILIAFCFGAFLEGCAGFGAPVAITTGMLVGLGFPPMRAVLLCLIANSAPVAFGSIGIPVITAGQVSGADPAAIGLMVARQLPLPAFLLPFWLIVMLAGWKGARGVLPVLFTAGAAYAVTMAATAALLGPALPDILASLVSLACVVALLRVWRPAEVWRFPGEAAAAESAPPVGGAGVRAWTPYVLLILFVANWGAPGFKAILDRATLKLSIPGLSGAISAAGRPLPSLYTFPALAAAGTAMLCAAMLAAMLLRTPVRIVRAAVVDTWHSLAYPIVTIGSIVGFAYLANLSGMSLALGRALTAAGYAFPFVAPVVGWLGVFITGSDTASNALFSGMQRTAGERLGLNPILTIAANTTGGVTGKMISPQSIAVAAAASSLTGSEGQIFRSALPHSIALLSVVCLITGAQARWFPGMIPRMAPGGAAAAASPGSGSWLLLGLSLVIIVMLAVLNSRAPTGSGAAGGEKA